MAVVCAIIDAVLEQRDYVEGAPWLFDDDQSDDNPHINGLVTWAFALITLVFHCLFAFLLIDRASIRFQNIVPISLYISVEAVRTCQAAFIYFDKDIWYEKTNQATLSRTWNLSDDLGQIEYIFSDKTGTLTQVCFVGDKYQVNRINRISPCAELYDLQTMLCGWKSLQRRPRTCRGGQ